MSENQLVDAPRKIDWSAVLQKNQDNKNTEMFEEVAIMNLAAASFVTDRTSDLKEGYEDESTMLAALMSVVVSDCMEASQLKTVPSIVPDFSSSMREAAASVFKDDSNKWILLINGNMYANAIRELKQKDSNPEVNRINLVRVLWSLAHEIGHIRQDEQLNIKPTRTSIDAIEVLDLVGNKTLSLASYALDKSETNANAFATKYFYTKVNDPEAAKIWKELDFSVTAKHVWKNINNSVLIKTVSDFKNAQKDREKTNDPVIREQLKKKMDIYSRTVSTHFKKRDKLTSIIDEKLNKN